MDVLKRAIDDLALAEAKAKANAEAEAIARKKAEAELLRVSSAEELLAPAPPQSPAAKPRKKNKSGMLCCAARVRPHAAALPVGRRCIERARRRPWQASADWVPLDVPLAEVVSTHLSGVAADHDELTKVIDQLTAVRARTPPRSRPGAAAPPPAEPLALEVATPPARAEKSAAEVRRASYRRAITLRMMALAAGDTRC